MATYAISMAEAKPSMDLEVTVHAAKGLSLLIESVDGSPFDVVERFVASELPAEDGGTVQPPVTPPTPPQPPGPGPGNGDGNGDGNGNGTSVPASPSVTANINRVWNFIRWRTHGWASWTRPEGATSFRYRQAFSGAWTGWSTTTGTSASLWKNGKESSYSCEVEACNSAGCSSSGSDTAS